MSFIYMSFLSLCLKKNLSFMSFCLKNNAIQSNKTCLSVKPSEQRERVKIHHRGGDCEQRRVEAVEHSAVTGQD